MRLLLERPVHCSDGPFGEIVDILVDPASRSVTHIEIEPHHRHWLARLAPIELVASAGDDEAQIMLDCTLEQAQELEHVQHSAVLPLGEEPAAGDDWDIGAGGVLVELDDNASGAHDAQIVATYDRIPKGEIEIRRVIPVTSADHHRVGSVEGLVVDGDERISHLLLEHGHFWGRREVAIPIGDVKQLESGAIALSLTRDAVGELPQIPLPRRPR